MKMQSKDFKRAVIFGNHNVWLCDNQLPGHTYGLTPLFDLGEGVCACKAPDDFAPIDLKAVELRASYQLLSEDEYRLSAKGAELIFWDDQTQYCAGCGSVLERVGNICKKCSNCDREYFPSPATAIIVLVTDSEDRALLVRAKNFKRPFFGLVAGFLESGETLEACVHREVREETSLEITDVQYFGSQSWPFPFQMMVGFTARVKSGEVKFADGELVEGGFYDRSNLPMLATPPSLARKLIDRVFS